jgi:hypothetical protein
MTVLFLLIGVPLIIYWICNAVSNFTELLIERGWIEENEESKAKKQIAEASKMRY